MEQDKGPLREYMTNLDEVSDYRGVDGEQSPTDFFFSKTGSKIHPLSRKTHTTPAPTQIILEVGPISEKNHVQIQTP